MIENRRKYSLYDIERPAGCIFASGMEAHRAETPILCLGGSVHDSPAPEGDAHHENKNSYGGRPKKEAGPMPRF